MEETKISLIGKNIRILRENMGFTQKSIANFLKVDQSMISKIEKGERALSVDMLDKLATLFGIATEQIEEKNIEKTELTFAFRGRDMSSSDLETIYYINRIALNSEFMSSLLQRGKE